MLRHRYSAGISLFAYPLPWLMGDVFGLAQVTQNTSGGITLYQFRNQAAAKLDAARSAAKTRDKTAAPPDLRSADELFLQVLLVQARAAAAQQSVDRLAGWRKSIESRFQTQNATELDL